MTIDDFRLPIADFFVAQNRVKTCQNLSKPFKKCQKALKKLQKMSKMRLFFTNLAGFGREIDGGHDASGIPNRKPPERDSFSEIKPTESRQSLCGPSGPKSKMNVR